MKKFELNGVKRFEFDASKAIFNEIRGDLIIEGYVSTPALDDGMDIVEPEAFTKAVLAKYMQKPIVLFMHRYNDLPVGKCLAVRVDKGKGLWASIQILPTETMGKDLIMVIRAGVVNSFSYSYRVAKYTIDEDAGTRTIHEFESMSEITVANRGMDFEATFTMAEKAGLEFKSKQFKELMHETLGDKYKSIRVQKGTNTLTPEELKQAIADGMAPHVAQVKAADVTIGEVQKEVTEVVILQKAMQSQQDKSEAERTEFMTKMLSDFSIVTGNLQAAITKMSDSKTPIGISGDPCPYSVKSMVSKPSKHLKRVFNHEKFGQLDEIRHTHDQVVMIDAIKAAADEDYARTPRRERLKELDCYKDYTLMTKAAFDTTTSDEGAQYLPTGYSMRMTDKVREQNRLAALHPTFQMTNSIQVLPVEGSDIEALRATEVTALRSAINASSQTPGSKNVTFTAEKFRGRTQFSGEADEDLIISVFDYIEMKVARSIGRAWERAIVNGDAAGATGLDSGDVPGATDPRYCWDGYRVATQAGNKVDLSTFSEKLLNKVRSKLGKYAVGSEEWFWLTSLTTYLMHFLDPDEVPSVRTLDKYGENATVITGELAKYSGGSIVTSEYVLNTLDATGVYSAAGNTRSIVQVVNRNAFWNGVWKDTSIEIIRNGIDDVYDIVGWKRGDFQCVFDQTAEDVTATGYGVTTD